MSNNYGYFDAVRDREIIKSGGFFCLGCLVAHPSSEKSQDGRYCQWAYDFLIKEAEMLDGRKPAWVPRVPARTALEPSHKRIEYTKKCVKTKNHIPVGSTAENSYCTNKKVIVDDSSKSPKPKGGRPILDLPLDQIKGMADQGDSVTDILRWLQGKGVEVSRRTIYNTLNR